MDRASRRRRSATAWGLLCGAGAALCWALGFVAARQGIDVGLSPFVIALDRFVWPGLALLPVVAADGFRDLGGLAAGGARVVLALFGGLPLALAEPMSATCLFRSAMAASSSRHARRSAACCCRAWC